MFVLVLIGLCYTEILITKLCVCVFKHFSFLFVAVNTHACSYNVSI